MNRKTLEATELIGSEIDGWHIAEHVGTGCNATVYRGFSEALQLSQAFKFIPAEKLAPGEAWKVEAQKANVLIHPSVVKCVQIVDARPVNDYVILKYEFVDGKSLREFVAKSREQVTVPFIQAFLSEMLDLFFEMRGRGIQHGDLHEGNVLVSLPSQYERNGKERFRVTDFGIPDVASDAVHLDDYEQLGRITTKLLSCVNYQKLSPEDKFAFNIINDHFVKKHFIEKDTTLDPLARNPDALLSRLEQIGTDYRNAAANTERNTLITPFDYLSCEQLGQQHSLLHALYSDKFLGIAEIEAANNLVVTGPRGCGKSTVFRSLSLKHRLNSLETPNLGDLRYFGLYYHCQDLYFKFPRYQLPSYVEALDIPLHYLTCRLVIEILETLTLIKRSDATVGLAEGTLCSKLWSLLELKRPKLPNSDTYDALLSALNKECIWAAEKHRFACETQPIARTLFGPDKLLAVCAEIQKNIDALSGTPFYCFIDDYSIPHISPNLQQNLNRILMQRNEFVFFKMSTESPVSYVAADVDGKAYTEGREFDVLNLGLTYLHGSKERKLEFLDDVFTRRLGAVPEYPVSTLEQLVGNSSGDAFNEIAERIAQGETLTWAGRETLSQMCSGDIHQLIAIVRKMVLDNGGREYLASCGDFPKIDAKRQHRAIRNHAGNFLQSLADSGVHGERLRKTVSAFGAIAHSYIKYKTSKNQSGSTRHQASRIELHEAPILTGEARAVYEELLRYSVFIQDSRGKSMRGNIVPRLYLRRFLVPHFNLTFSLRDSVLMNAQEFIDLLTDPEGFESKRRLRQPVSEEQPSIQGTLDLGEGGNHGN